MTSFYGSYSSIGSCSFLLLSLAFHADFYVPHWQITKVITLGDGSLARVLFNILGLIAAAGLPDRLLRNQLREVLENKSWASKSN